MIITWLFHWKNIKYAGCAVIFLFNLTQFYLNHAPQIGELRGWKKEKVYKEAMKLSKKAASLSPEDFSLQKDYALNFFTAANFGVEADWKSSAKAWEAAREIADNDTDLFLTWLNEARAWIKAEENERAIPCLKEAITLHPDGQAARNWGPEIGESARPTSV